MHVIEPSENPACCGIHIRARIHQSPALELAPRQYARGTNQALAPTFWSPFIRNDIGIALHAECAKPVSGAHSMNVKDKTVAATRLTATMNHHSHPVIGANSGNSELLDMTPRSSPKVLIAQTPNLLSAASEQYAPFRQSFGEVQARLFRKMATKSASNLPHAPIKGHPHRSVSEATVEHSPINHQH